uniref:Antitoxin n=1 Tax=Candidatus Kentrum sp. FW TaxID=2126338 RepID=A0A450T9V4_9GAMM|nr:MAG: Antitoxin component YafN of the YafNO toxin-antitoxin module, PHD/YefM family [Candidatus Kentron sp. FW]
MTMTIYSATDASEKFYGLIDETVDMHRPTVIAEKKGNAIPASEEDWNAISETLHLLSVPGMRESIREGMETPVDECTRELDW